MYSGNTGIAFMILGVILAAVAAGALFPAMAASAVSLACVVVLVAGSVMTTTKT